MLPREAEAWKTEEKEGKAKCCRERSQRQGCSSEAQRCLRSLPAGPGGFVGWGGEERATQEREEREKEREKHKK